MKTDMIRGGNRLTWRYIFKQTPPEGFWQCGFGTKAVSHYQHKGNENSEKTPLPGFTVIKGH